MNIRQSFMISAVFLFSISIFLNAQIKYNVKEITDKKVKTSTWNESEVQFIANELAVKISSSAKQSEIEKLLESVDGKIINEFDELGWGLIELPSDKDEINTIKELMESPLVITAEPNMITWINFTPNDPYFAGSSPAEYAHQWALNNTGQTPPTGTSDADIDAPEAWNISTGDTNVVIAILDSGIPMIDGALSHPDLDDPDKIILGPDYYYNRNVRDLLGHGTHVTGIAAAESNNGTGIAGIAWNCKIMVIKVFGNYIVGDWTAFYNGVVYAVNYQRDNPGKRVVINFSGAGAYSQQAQDAVEFANNYGVPIIAGAGNDSQGSVSYPARYSADYSNVIAVSSTDADDAFSSFSNFGPRVCVSAPGGYGGRQSGYVYYYNSQSIEGKNIYSTTPNYQFNLAVDPYYEGDPYSTDVTQTYGYMSGTSMATPHVTGIAALLLSINPDLTPSQIRDIIEQTADDKGDTGFDDYFGYGRVNAYKALKFTLENYGGTLSQDLTIPFGETWDFQPGVTLTFTNGASLVADSYGILTLSGTSSDPITFDFVSPNSSTKNGIKIDDGSIATIGYCRIQNAYRGIYEHGYSINVNCCSFSNCYHGLYLYNSSPTIRQCRFQNNDGAGIYLVNSSPYLYNNYMINNYYGVYCTSSSNPKFGYMSTRGENGLTNNYCGVYCRNNSYPLIGQTSPFIGGYNNLDNAAYNIYNASSGTVYAHHIWWGTTSTSSFKIYGSGTTSYTNYLSTSVEIDPEPPLSKSSYNADAYASDTSDILMISELDRAYQLAASNELEEAREVCLNLVNNYPDCSVSYNALNLLKETYTEEETASQIELYESLFNQKEKKDINAAAGLILANIDEENRLERIDDVINNYAGENVEPAIFDKFIYYYFEIEDEEKALAVCKELDDRYPDSHDAYEAHRILGDEEYLGIDDASAKESVEDTVATVPEDVSLLECYPNPFNPTTIITFTLPESDKVKLIVYDILGREVIKLADGTYEAGEHKFQFNASNLASGVYIYRLQTSSKVLTKKMMLLK